MTTTDDETSPYDGLAHSLTIILLDAQKDEPELFYEVRSWSDMHDVCDANMYVLTALNWQELPYTGTDAQHAQMSMAVDEASAVLWPDDKLNDDECVESRDPWGRQILTVGQLRSILAMASEDTQVVMDDGDGWYVNVEATGVPGGNEHWSCITLMRGSTFDSRQF